MTLSAIWRAACMPLLLTMWVAGNPVHAQEKVHGANSVFIAPTVKIGWAIQKGASEDTTLVVIRVVDGANQYRQVRLDGVDPFNNRRKVLISSRPLGGKIDLSVPRSSFADFPSSEIHLFRSELAAEGQPPNLTVYYLGVPDTTPEFTSALDVEAYLGKALGQ
jgi:hypothetical protein